jgi:hypothetical protein
MNTFWVYYEERLPGIALCSWHGSKSDNRRCYSIEPQRIHKLIQRLTRLGFLFTPFLGEAAGWKAEKG